MRVYQYRSCTSTHCHCIVPVPLYRSCTHCHCIVPAHYTHIQSYGVDQAEPVVDQSEPYGKVVEGMSIIDSCHELAVASGGVSEEPTKPIIIADCGVL